MVSKAKIKFIKSLQVKKYRKQEQSFVVEGAKSVEELLHADFEITWLAGTEEFVRRHEKIVARRRIETVVADEKNLSQVGSFQTNNAAIAVARMRPNVRPVVENNFCLVLDDLRDPGTWVPSSALRTGTGLTISSPLRRPL